MAEFSGIRSKLYKECLREFPESRLEDIKVMQKYLKPKSNETILEVGAGSGFFSKVLAEILKKGKLIVSDPSEEQLEEVKGLNKDNIEVILAGADTLDLPKETIDAIWSFGAVHHVNNKKKAFENFARILKKKSRLVIADVFSGSTLAKHFNEKVTKFCITGHKVTFLTKDKANDLCHIVGLGKPEFYDLNIHWKFKTKEEIGLFLYKIHAMTKTSPENCLKGAEEILGIYKDKEGIYCLNWPMTVMISNKK